MKSYETYIFDLDGTITDTTAVWLTIFSDALLHFGITPPANTILAKHTHDFAEMFKFGLAEKDLLAYREIAHVLANERLPQASLHVGAYDALVSLRESGKQLAIFSTMGRVSFDPVMRDRNLYPLVHVAVAGDDVPYRKPHPAGILKALKDLKIPQERYSQAVYVGDKDTDIQAAKSAGIASILYYPSSHHVMYDLEELQKHKPTHIITDWQELLLENC
ncbi:MAG: HAD family hydrolase [Patescibacteria group bacterium]